GEHPGVHAVELHHHHADGLARAIEEVLGDAGRRAELGAAGARRARERYGWPRVAERTEAVYTQVMDGKVGRLAALGG
ncbi:hypothetical protein AB0M50_56410, partial [Nonomuraea fuscirosea]|uniref:glycosyltransferase n=1 Tax=Nonomuraea fuscirosea TaxID=1291556 RepID=UPI0034874A29